MAHTPHPHETLDPGAEFEPGDARYRVARRVTVIGAIINLALSVVKIAVGLVGQSHALVADGIHSLSDLASDILVVWASKHGSREADEDHPYGHGRIETVATVALGSLLIAVAGGILWDAGQRMLAPATLLHPGVLALVVAAVSVLSKEALYQYTMVVARRLRSSLLQANAWHHRSDAVSSVVVLVGVGGAMAGFSYLDAVAAGIVALMVGKMGWDLAANAVYELIDTALDTERVAVIRKVIFSVNGVKDIHLLRTRRHGADALVDVHIILADPYISVSEGHQISETVRAKLIREIDEVRDVTVHIDPEDDLGGSPSRDLPLRDKVLASLPPEWEQLCRQYEVDDLRLHYLDGKVNVEVLVPLAAAGDTGGARAVAAAFKSAAQPSRWVHDVVVRFH